MIPNGYFKGPWINAVHHTSSQVESSCSNFYTLKDLCMCILWLLVNTNTIFLALETYTENTPWKMESINDVVNVVAWLFLKIISGAELRN